MKLLRKPFEPKPTAKYVFGRYVEEIGDWAQYLEGW
jgi:hypothetical protein